MVVELRAIHAGDKYERHHAILNAAVRRALLRELRAVARNADVADETKFMRLFIRANSVPICLFRIWIVDAAATGHAA